MRKSPGGTPREDGSARVPKIPTAKYEPVLVAAVAMLLAVAELMGAVVCFRDTHIHRHTDTHTHTQCNRIDVKALSPMERMKLKMQLQLQRSQREEQEQERKRREERKRLGLS